MRHFGRPLDEDFVPGLYWRWPWPIEEVIRTQPDRIRSVEIGFRPLPGSKAETASFAWSSQHVGEMQTIPAEAVMITGDNNLVELQAVVRYRVARPRVYLFEVKEADELIRANATVAALRQAVAGQPFLELLTSRREQFQKDVLADLEKRCQDYGPGGLGIAFDGLTVRDLHPPLEVVDAYHNVTRAMQERDREVNRAWSEPEVVPWTSWPMPQRKVTTCVTRPKPPSSQQS